MSLIEEEKKRRGYAQWQTKDKRPYRADSERPVFEVELTHGMSLAGGDVAFGIGFLNEFGFKDRAWATFDLEQLREIVSHLDKLVVRLEVDAAIGESA